MPRFAVHIGFVLLVNTLIAAFLTAIGIGGDFIRNLIVSHCIGFSIYLPCIVTARRAASRTALLTGIALSVVFGSVVGALAGFALAGYGFGRWSFGAVLSGLLFGLGVSGLFHLHERAVKLESALRERELQRLAAEKAQVETQLRLLQAQIEPHFLFNTLANLAVLVRSDPARAERLLADLIAWLRATLQRTRDAASTLGDEIELLRCYLDILGLRLGERLRVVIDVPEALRARPFPLLLLQPLVENAVAHGIEPKVDGGEVRIAAAAAHGRLRLTVADTGAGLAESGGGAGFGLENVRQRLKALFGDAAALDVRANPSGGVTATVELPA
ncbi:MAG: histidine kinase [Zoogloeaceae bacterium]|jgi:sensor histidine kinase YesM|nr:histidine kinase [Zoogloeaceae bacterium]